MFPTSKAIKNREKSATLNQAIAIRRRRAGSWRFLRAHSTTSEPLNRSTPRVSQTKPVRYTKSYVYPNNPTQFEVLCSAFFQESAFPRSPTSTHQNTLSGLRRCDVLFRLSCILPSLGGLASWRLLRRRILLLCARLRLRPLILSLLLPGKQ